MYKKYQIVLTPFPFTDLSSHKVRPAVIVSDKALGDDVVVVFVSSRDTKQKDKFSLRIKKDKTNRLKVNSIIKVSKIATLDKKIILGEIGELNKKYQLALDKILKQIFGI